MTGAEWTVLLGGLALIGWINWYFLLARPRAVTAEAAGGFQTVPVVVEGGYQPAEIRVRAGIPVRLLFERRETAPCSEAVVLPEFGHKRFLPPHRTTALEFVPTTPGAYEFRCGMGMLRGRITATAGEAR